MVQPLTLGSPRRTNKNMFFIHILGLVITGILFQFVSDGHCLPRPACATTEVYAVLLSVKVSTLVPLGHQFGIHSCADKISALQILWNSAAEYRV